MKWAKRTIQLSMLVLEVDEGTRIRRREGVTHGSGCREPGESQGRLGVLLRVGIIIP